jgi:hypothetical protein
MLYSGGISDLVVEDQSNSIVVEGEGWKSELFVDTTVEVQDDCGASSGPG